MSALICRRCRGVLERARALVTCDNGGRVAELSLVLGGRRWPIRVFLCQNCREIELFLDEKPETRIRTENQSQTVTTQIFGRPRQGTVRARQHGPDWNRLKELIAGAGE